jgi:GNAT superfamily N-acetyltransferase
MRPASSIRPRAIFMQFEIRNLTVEYAAVASVLTNESFKKFVALDWEADAIDAFLDTVSTEAFAEILRTSAYSIGMFHNNALVGVLIMSKPTIVRMLFTHVDWMRQGIGRSLWLHARAHLESNVPDARTIELNSSPFAVSFYRSLGFTPISAEYTMKGARATRMACWLPAVALGAEP